MTNQLFALFVLTVAATESAIGLALLVIIFWIHKTIVM
jgi:NADH:ubiquinone oxidoreductase subunit K